MKLHAFLLRGLVIAGLLLASTPLASFADQDASAAVQQVIQRSNDEQVQAIASHDSSLMADTTTADHYQDLVRVNQDLLDNGVSSISLVKLEWGAVAVDGSSATATTYETWRTVYADGTNDQSRDRNDYSLVLDNGNWKIQSDDHPDVSGQVPGQVPPNAIVPPQTQPFPFPDDQNTSHNWSGYAATGGTFTEVSGTWNVPDFNAGGAGGVDAAWVGIGGVRSRDLIQAGTQQTVSGSGRTQYQAWIEMLPRASRPVPLQVHAGDSVSVSIAEQSPDQWLIHFVNNTTGQTYDTTQTYTSSHSSAEWVEEAPSGGGRRGGVLPLDEQLRDRRQVVHRRGGQDRVRQLAHHLLDRAGRQEAHPGHHSREHVAEQVEAALLADHAPQQLGGEVDDLAFLLCPGGFHQDQVVGVAAA